MTTTRRWWPPMWLIRWAANELIKNGDPADNERLRKLTGHTYFAEIAMGNREVDAAEQMRLVDLTSLENFASGSLGPNDPRILGRRADGTAILR